MIKTNGKEDSNMKLSLDYQRPTALAGANDVHMTKILILRGKTEGRVFESETSLLKPDLGLQFFSNPCSCQRS